MEDSVKEHEEMAESSTNTENVSADTVKSPSSSSSSQAGSLAKAMSTVALNLANLAEGELQGSNNLVELIEKLNLKTATEYDDYADFASGLLVFVERLKHKNDKLCDHLQMIDEIDQEVCQLEAVVSTLDNYTSNLESKIRAAYGDH